MGWDAPAATRYLLEHGLRVSAELPHPVTTADKMHGVWKFGSSHGKARATRFGRGITVNSTNAVYFLKHEHDVLGAIVEWFHANETCFDAPKKEVTTILAANEKEWWPEEVKTDAWRHFSDRFEWTETEPTHRG